MRREGRGRGEWKGRENWMDVRGKEKDRRERKGGRMEKRKGEWEEEKEKENKI